MPFSMGWTTTTLPSKPVFSSMLETIQSANALRKLPSPNCIMRSGRIVFAAVVLLSAFIAKRFRILPIS